MNKSLNANKKPQLNLAANIVNRYFLDSDYQGKDWEGVRVSLIKELNGLLESTPTSETEIEARFRCKEEPFDVSTPQKISQEELNRFDENKRQLKELRKEIIPALEGWKERLNNFLNELKEKFDISIPQLFRNDLLDIVGKLLKSQREELVGEIEKQGFIIGKREGGALREQIVEILREFNYANIDLEPERTTEIQKAETSMETEKEYTDKILNSIRSLLKSQREELMGKIWKEIEKEKEKIFNSEKFYDLEEVYELLGNLQEKLKKL